MRPCSDLSLRLTFLQGNALANYFSALKAYQEKCSENVSARNSFHPPVPPINCCSKSYNLMDNTATRHGSNQKSISRHHYRAVHTSPHAFLSSHGTSRVALRSLSKLKSEPSSPAMVVNCCRQDLRHCGAITSMPHSRSLCHSALHDEETTILTTPIEIRHTGLLASCDFPRFLKLSPFM